VTKSYNYTQSIHRLTSNSSSTTDFPWLSPTDNWTQFSFSDSLLYSTVRRYIPIPLTLLNSQFQFSNPIIQFSNLLLTKDSCYIDSARTTQETRATCQTACSLAITRTGLGAYYIENTSSVVRMRVSSQSCGPLPSTGHGTDHIENASFNTLSSVACAYFGRCLEMGLRVTINSEALKI
jgi:hypothetical protein